MLLVQSGFVWGRLYGFYKKHHRRVYTLVTPNAVGSIQKIQAASLKDFLCFANFESLRDGCRPTASYIVYHHDPFS